jgi:hypothetical protein
MKNGLLFLVIFLLPFWSNAQEEELRSPGEFDKLLVKGIFQVTIIKSDKNSVKITPLTDYALSSDISTIVKAGRLEIWTKKKSFKDKDFHITVYYKDLTSIHVKNDAEVLTEPNVVLKGDSISLYCSIGGKIKVQVEVKKLIANIKQGGSILLKGSAPELDASIFTGGRISASQLKTDNVASLIKMGGEMIVKPVKYLNAKVVSGGTIKYQGIPGKIDEEIKIGGTIKKIK